MSREPHNYHTVFNDKWWHWSFDIIMTHFVISHWNYDHRHTSLWQEVTVQVKSSLSKAYCRWDNQCVLTWTVGGGKTNTPYSSSWEREGNLEKAKVSCCAVGLFTGSSFFSLEISFTSWRRLTEADNFHFFCSSTFCAGSWDTKLHNRGGWVSLGQVDVELPVVVRPLHVLPLYQTLKRDRW